MCLILLKPKSVILPKKLFKNVIERNKNGFGFMLLDKQKNIITYKTISKNWEEHYDAFAPYNNNDYEVGIHWRLKTQGDEILENTHPFEVKKDEIYMMHNGTISGLQTKEDNKSDTYHFINQILNPYINSLKKPKYLFDNPINKHILAKIIGDYNKLLFLTKDGFIRINTFFITDEQYIPQIRGLIFSNTYAWDNQFWYKDAYQNEINEEYVTRKKESYSSGGRNNVFEHQNYHRRFFKPESTPLKKENTGTEKPKAETKQNKDYTTVTLKKQKRETNQQENCQTNELTITTYHLYKPNPPIEIVKNTKEETKENKKEETLELPKLLLPKPPEYTNLH